MKAHDDALFPEEWYVIVQNNYYSSKNYSYNAIIMHGQFQAEYSVDLLNGYKPKQSSLAVTTIDVTTQNIASTFPALGLAIYS